MHFPALCKPGSVIRQGVLAHCAAQCHAAHIYTRRKSILLALLALPARLWIGTGAWPADGADRVKLDKVLQMYMKV